MPTIDILWPALFVGIYAGSFLWLETTAERFVWALPPFLLQVSWWLIRTASRWVTVLLAALIALPPLPIKMGDSGPHVGVAIASVGLLAGVLRLNEWTGKIRRSELFLFFYLLVLLLSLAPALVIHDSSLVLSSLIRVALFGISIYVYAYTAHGPMNFDAPPVRLIYYAAMFSAAFACIDFFWQLPPPAGFGPQYVWLPSGIYRRAQGVFYEASTLGNFSVFFLMFIAVSAFRPKSERGVSRIALAVGGALFLSTLVLSFSRASLVNLGVALTTLLFLKRKRIRLARVAAFGLCALLLAAVSTYALLPQVVEFYLIRLYGSLELLAVGNEAVFSGRIATWNFIGSYLAEHPIQSMIGVGYKTLPYSDFVGTRIVADNAYLSALLETGIIGLAAMLLFNAAILRIAFRTRSIYSEWIGCFWVGQLFQMLSGDLLTYWRVLPVYLWVLALAARQDEAE